MILKELGYLLSKPQRDEIVKQNFSIVVGGLFAIDRNREKIFVAPYVKTKLDKKFKEKMRKEGIPPKVRGYLKKVLSSSEKS